MSRHSDFCNDYASVDYNFVASPSCHICDGTQLLIHLVMTGTILKVRKWFVNEQTPLNRYYLSTLDELVQKVRRSGVLSTVDLTSGFHQIPMEESSSNMTTFVSPLGKYRFLRMPFGLKNAPAVFQKVMDKILCMVKDCCDVYIDDVVIFSKDWETHLCDLKRVLKTIERVGMKVKLRKCVFGRKRLKYLGHIIGEGVVTVPESRVLAFKNYGRHKTKRQLRTFLGAIGYYRRFIPGFAEMAANLTPSTRVRAPVKVMWCEEMKVAFSALCDSLCVNVMLFVPSPEDQFKLYTDASGVGVGACLHAVRKDGEVPIGFYSRQLHGAEKGYSVTELETLAIVAGINHYDRFIYGQHFVVITDHKPCTALLGNSHLNKRLRRFANSLQERDMNIMYRAGGQHLNADAMSRRTWEPTDPPFPGCL